jgi:hypothetical protein
VRPPLPTPDEGPLQTLGALPVFDQMVHTYPTEGGDSIGDDLRRGLAKTQRMQEKAAALAGLEVR